MDANEKKLDTIAKLLAKAERTTPEEAEALTEHAVRLMKKYQIDQAAVDERRRAEGKTSEAIVERSVKFTGTYHKALADMAAYAVWGLGDIRVLESKRDRSTVIFLVGFEGDVEQAVVLVQSLHLQALVAMRTFWNANKAAYRYASDWDRRKARDHFIRGFGHGVFGRLEAARRKVLDEAGSGAELVLVSRKARVDEHVDAMGLGNSKPTNTRFDERARHEGAKAGRSAQTGERSLDQGKALSA